MPVQVDVIIHRVTVNTSIQRPQPLNIHRWLLTLHLSVLSLTPTHKLAGLSISYKCIRTITSTGAMKLINRVLTKPLFSAMM